MKRKMTAPRNPFVAAAKFKKAGAHGKTTKALRRTEKMELERGSGRVATGTWLLTRQRTGSNPSVPTSIKPSAFAECVSLDVAHAVRWQSGNALDC